MADKISEIKRVWVSYIDDSGAEVNGYFILLEQNENFIKIKSGINILTIPYHRLNKMKERENGN